MGKATDVCCPRAEDVEPKGCNETSAIAPSNLSVAVVLSPSSGTIEIGDKKDSSTPKRSKKNAENLDSPVDKSSNESRELLQVLDCQLLRQPKKLQCDLGTDGVAEDPSKGSLPACEPEIDVMVAEPEVEIAPTAATDTITDNGSDPGSRSIEPQTSDAT
ncbi:hypothetical protein Droror1_Dr00023034 [Drosera rotundifolia]